MADLNKEALELLKALKTEVELLRAENLELGDRIKQTEDRIPDMVSNLDEINRRNDYATGHKPEPKLIETNGSKINKKTGDREDIAFTGKKDCCPFCNDKKKSNLLDITTSGRWACRRCGKHWYEEALNQPYSKELEKFIKVGDEEDPINIFRNKKDAEDKDLEMDNLKKELSELKNLVIKSSLAKNAG